jgi:hypothetical protein
MLLLPLYSPVRCQGALPGAPCADPPLIHPRLAAPSPRFACRTCGRSDPTTIHTSIQSCPWLRRRKTPSHHLRPSFRIVMVSAVHPHAPVQVPPRPPPPPITAPSPQLPTHQKSAVDRLTAGRLCLHEGGAFPLNGYGKLGAYHTGDVGVHGPCCNSR